MAQYTWIHIYISIQLYVQLATELMEDYFWCKYIFLQRLKKAKDHIKDKVICYNTKKFKKIFHVAAWSDTFFFCEVTHKKTFFRPVISRPESAEKSSLDVPDNTIWSAWKKGRIYSLKEHLFTRYEYNLAHFLEPIHGFKVHQGNVDITGIRKKGRAGNGWGLNHVVEFRWGRSV